MSLLGVRVPENREAAPPGQDAFQDFPRSHPVAEVDIWQDYLPNPYSWMNSLLIHLLAITALVLPFEFGMFRGAAPIPTHLFEVTPLQLTLPRLHRSADHTGGGGGGGGGGRRDPLPASRGALPEFSRTQLTPPSAVIPKTPPLLAMQPTLLGPPDLKLPEMKMNAAWGDPKGVIGPASSGPGYGSGIGTGNGTGVGPGAGPGYGPGIGGGCCGGVYSVGGGVSAPVPVYSPEPAYSEEARRAKYVGNVILWVVVDAHGTVQSIRVAKPLGMGLDEEAVKTVSTWRFKPALRQGAAVPVKVQVEVSFRLF